MSPSAAGPSRITVIHPLVVRVTHWINAVAVFCMLFSGWAIYNASPFFPIVFPKWATLGGWLGGALAWHFAAMWLFALNGLAYVLYGLFARHFAKSFLPVSPRAFWRDASDAVRLRLVHRIGEYNAVQRVAYLVAFLLGILLVASGLALWKPIQLQGLASLFGGYEWARRVHFLAMSGLVGFILLHLALVILVPRTLVAMVTGRARIPIDPVETRS
ncbi:cytochrome b/b6 domain-containing protein [Methylobacterium sp. E-045]|uniref:cytochrome b/b6 domain-containing protein n=1 Tax=Methylobacterium sp. E-045 TaxID=2836575 RepID=UPI001FBBF94E|nr:cytochrome b/b6 domain-containing protein [Methylobacterium sp. E-045]MCJ2127631.1 cytochrome b/b6 domain-containing protein [Methylobacterium sp. E-045]